jgi:hypothetical protein
MSIDSKAWCGAAGAAALSATVLLTVAPHAHAAPCDWSLPAHLTFIQDNNIQVQLTAYDDKLYGEGQYAHVGTNDWTVGYAKGGIAPNGHGIVMSVNWTDGPGKGLYNNYFGQIAEDGSMSGTTTNSQGATNGWTSQQPAICGKPFTTGSPVLAPDDPPPPQNPPPNPPPPAAPKPQTATINGDVDVYGEPGGVGSPGRTLEKGTIVTIVEWRDDNWVKLADIGWVWGDFVQKR